MYKKAKHRILIIVITWINCILFTNAIAQDKDHDIKILTEKITKELLNSKPVGDVQNIAQTMSAIGKWGDIDYDDTINAQFKEHAVRLKQMALAYNEPNNPSYNSTEILNKIKLGFEFFYNKKWQASNWWYTEIGIPNDYMAALILMKGNIDKKDILRYASFLKDATNKKAHQGMNRVWVSAITIYKGCIEDNNELVMKGFASIASTLSITEGPEGIKIDNSFQQHRGQLYSGGYGRSFATEISYYMQLSSNTIFTTAFSKEQLAIYTNFLLNGEQLFGYRKSVDYGSIGRNISRNNGVNNISITPLKNMIISDKLHAQDYVAWSKHLNGDVFPEKYRGVRFFWKSAIMISHGSNFYLSAKMPSSRTTGTEMLNNENLLGYNLPLGATNILVTGNEYRNIFPVWDWSRVPGTTAIHNNDSAKLPWYFFGTNDFAGGVTDSSFGINAYEHAYRDVTSKKAYFFLGDYLLCLGAGINSNVQNEEVLTSVDQSWDNGQVIYGGLSRQTERLQNGNITIPAKKDSLFWVCHNNIGYVFPQGGNVTIQLKKQEGSWKKINVSGSSDKISRHVFSTWISHGSNPKNDSYCYIVVPNIIAESIQQNKNLKQIEFVRNDTSVQAVKFGNTYAVVFYKPGDVAFQDGLSITAHEKIMLLVMHSNDGYYISIADPIYSQPFGSIEINKKLIGNGASFTQGKTTLKFDFPKGDMVGSSRTFHYTE